MDDATAEWEITASETAARELGAEDVMLSACLIVRNEERHLEDCLRSLAGRCDEIVVVDTGSIDRTPEIARRCGARVVHEPWRHDFSHARNVSIGTASGDWCLCIDADERLDGSADLRKVIERAEADVLFVEIANDLPSGGVAMLRAPRLFRRRSTTRFEGVVHNQLVFDGPAAHAEVRLRHLGYAESPEILQRKFERSVPLLEAQIAENPDDPFPHFNLSVFLLRAGRADESAAHARTCNALLEASSRRGCPLHTAALDIEGLASSALGHDEHAIRCFERALEFDPGATDAAFDLSLALEKAGRTDDALRANSRYFEARQIESNRPPSTEVMTRSLGSVEVAWNNRGLLELRRGCVARARAAFAASIGCRSSWATPFENWGDLEAQRARFDLAQPLFAEARRIETDSSRLHAKLGVVAIRNGDFEMAERAFERLVELQPADDAARAQLASIQKQRALAASRSS